MSGQVNRALLLLISLTTESLAATRYAKVGGTGDCTSWASACSLTSAISGAVDGDQVWVKAGTYGPIDLLNGVKIVGGFAGTETLVTQSNSTINVTILDGNGARCATNINAAPTTSPAYLRGFVLRNGRGDGGDEAGAVYLENSAAHFVQCIFEDNSAMHMGGAVSMKGAGSPQFYNCIFRRNGQSASLSPLDTKGGGAIFVRDGSPRFVNCLFDNNQAGEGGAVIVADGFPTFVNCTFVKNVSTVGRGGAVFDPDGRVDMKNCIVWSNRRALNGANVADQFYTGSGGTTVATHSNVEGSWTGSNNISADPLFANAEQENYQLTAGSPCKNTGDPNNSSAVAPDSVDFDWDGDTNEQVAKDLGQLPRLRLGRVDMGAYELFNDTPPGGGGDP